MDSRLQPTVTNVPQRLLPLVSNGSQRPEDGRRHADRPGLSLAYAVGAERDALFERIVAEQPQLVACQAEAGRPAPRSSPPRSHRLGPLSSPPVAVTGGRSCRTARRGRKGLFDAAMSSLSSRLGVVCPGPRRAGLLDWRAVTLTGAGHGQTRYSAEFRRRVIDLVAAGHKVADVARDLGVSDQIIYVW